MSDTPDSNIYGLLFNLLLFLHNIDLLYRCYSFIVDLRHKFTARNMNETEHDQLRESTLKEFYLYPCTKKQTTQRAVFCFQVLQVTKQRCSVFVLLGLQQWVFGHQVLRTSCKHNPLLLYAEPMAVVGMNHSDACCRLNQITSALRRN